MIRTGVVFFAHACALVAAFAAAGKPVLPSFGASQARAHEIKPHRHTVSMAGIGRDYSMLDLTLTVSPQGRVLKAVPSGGKEVLACWPQLRSEVMQWRFRPFEAGGKAVTALVEEHIRLVPPEQLPQTRVAPPELRPASNIFISLSRSGCYGTCPVYSVSIGAHGGIEFFGQSYVAEKGAHSIPISPDSVRALAREFIDADFYSMQDEYLAHVTDLPTTGISIAIDGRQKKITGYQGVWAGMPALVKDLEEEIDWLAESRRWIYGPDGNSPRPR